MIIVGFTNKTSKILPRVFCRRFRHCAPIIINAQGHMILYQFVRRGHVAQIKINMRDMRLLRAHGWVFICVPYCTPKNKTRNACTCVALTCDMIGINKWRPITPDALYKKLKKFPFGDFSLR